MPGPLEHSPLDVCKELLIALGLGTRVSLKQPWPVFSHVEPDMPDEALTVVPGAWVDQGRDSFGETAEREGATVRVRARTDDAAFAKTNQVQVALDSALDVDVAVSGAGYRVHSVSRDGDASSLGKDANSERSVYQLALTMSIRRR